MLFVGAGARREANKHQLQAGYSLQIMSFGYGWAIDVTILCCSNDAHVGHQLRLSAVGTGFQTLSVNLTFDFGSCHFFLVLTLPPFSFPSHHLISGCDAGQLGLNQNQMDTVSKLSKRV